jgi:hypothetical protein
MAIFRTELAVLGVVIRPFHTDWFTLMLSRSTSTRWMRSKFGVKSFERTPILGIEFDPHRPYRPEGPLREAFGSLTIATGTDLLGEILLESDVGRFQAGCRPAEQTTESLAYTSPAFDRCGKTSDLLVIDRQCCH